MLPGWLVTMSKCSMLLLRPLPALSRSAEVDSIGRRLQTVHLQADVSLNIIILFPMTALLIKNSLRLLVNRTGKQFFGAESHFLQGISVLPRAAILNFLEPLSFCSTGFI